MSISHRQAAVRSFLVLAAAGLDILVGVLALIGWVTVNGTLVQWDPQLAPLSFNAAVAFTLLGLGLVALSRGLARTAVVCALPVILYGTLIVLSEILGARWGLSHLLFTPGFVIGRTPPHAPPLAALMMLIAAVALAFAALSGARFIGPASGALLMALGAAGLIGQLAPLWPIWGGLRAIALPAALATFVSGVAALGYGWQELRRRRFGLAFVTATVFMAAALVLAGALRTYEQDELARMTASAWQGVAYELHGETRRPLAVARLAARWSALGVPPMARARREGRLLLVNIPGLLALDWVAPSTRVLWRVPRAGSAHVVGRLLRADPERAQALARARTLRRAVMTPLIPLFRGGRGFVVAAPVWRHQRFQGWLAGVFSTSGLFSRITATLWRGYDVTVGFGPRVVFRHGHKGDRRYRQAGPLPFLGQTLRLSVSPGPRILRKIEVGLPAIVLTSGFLLAVFAAAAVFAQQEAKRHAESLDRLNAGLEGVIATRTQALREERERWRVTLMSIGDGVIVTDAGGRVLALNGEAERLTGFRDAEARLLPIATVLPLQGGTGEGQAPEDAAARPESLIGEVLGRGVTRHLKSALTLTTRDGRVLRVSDSAAPIRDEAGHVRGAVVVFRDVTEHQALTEQAQKARSLEALGVLAGGIAHDFNNILTAIFGNITLAKIYAPNDEALRVALADAERASLRARELTFQLLTFAKGGAPVKKAGAIGDLVRDLTEFFLKGSAVRSAFSIPDDLGTIDFDPDQMGQVIQNIVLNAKEAMGGAGILQVRARNVTLASGEAADLPGGDYVEIAFQDSGPGIAPEHLPRIFDPYFSLKPSGTGLGLAVTYSVVRRHQGAVIADSVSGQGTTLTLYLPRTRKAQVSARAPRDGDPERARPGRGERILLMDDDPDVRAIGAELLRRLGYRVAEAESGEAAIRLYDEACPTAPFAAVILDLTVAGGMGGKECVRALAMRAPDVRAIVATGYYIDPIVAEDEAYGLRGAVQKPYRMEELAETLARTLQA